MRTKALLLLAALAVLSVPVLADEGQWTPDQLATLPKSTWDSLKKRGVTLDAKALWDGSGGGLLASVAEIGGCTASFISGSGLMVTNHHCAYQALQLASTKEKNLLRDGLVTRSRSEEPQVRGGAARALILTRLEDVTAQVKGPAFTGAKDDYARWEAAERVKKELVAGCEKGGGKRCKVAVFDEGLRYVLQEQTELQDIRLVFAPPAAIGEFGGETDNFRWPRHTGDFSFLRAYVGPDGKPAPYSEKNVPYKPARFLNVSQNGVPDGGAVMILGYPGRTRRYLTQAAITNMAEQFYPLRAEHYAALIAILEGAGKGDPDIALKVASTVNSLGNRVTNAKGQIEGLRRNRIVAKSRAEAEELAAFLAKGGHPPAWKNAVGEVDRLAKEDAAGQPRRFFLDEVEAFPGYLKSALTALRFADERAKADLDRDAGYQDRDLDRARLREKDATRSMAPAAWRKGLAYLVAKAQENAGERGIAALDEAFGRNAKASDIEEKLAAWDKVTALSDEATRLRNLDARAEDLRSASDPYLTFAVALSRDLLAQRRETRARAGKLLTVEPDAIAALKALRGSQGKPIYPDANSTLRIAFAEVKGYSPKEGLVATPRTTLTGLFDKVTGEDPFVLPERLRPAFENISPKSPYFVPALGSVPACFLTNGDTTGGNSGSPTLNGQGELVGLNFDRVWENVAGDFGWNADRSRNVNVDIRFALFLMKIEKADTLLEEILRTKGTL